MGEQITCGGYGDEGSQFPFCRIPRALPLWPASNSSYCMASC